MCGAGGDGRRGRFLLEVRAAERRNDTPPHISDTVLYTIARPEQSRVPASRPPSMLTVVERTPLMSMRLFLMLTTYGIVYKTR